MWDLCNNYRGTWLQKKFENLRVRADTEGFKAIKSGKVKRGEYICKAIYLAINK